MTFGMAAAREQMRGDLFSGERRVPSEKSEMAFFTSPHMKEKPMFRSNPEMWGSLNLNSRTGSEARRNQSPGMMYTASGARRSLGSEKRIDGGPGEDTSPAELLLHPQEIVVFRDPLPARQGAGLDLARIDAHR